MPKDASGKVILDTVDLRDTWEVSSATVPKRTVTGGHHCMGAEDRGSDPICLCPQTCHRTGLYLQSLPL